MALCVGSIKTHTVILLRNNFYWLFPIWPLIHKYWTSLGYKYWRASVSATCGQRAMTTFTWSAFNSVSFPITCRSIFLAWYLALVFALNVSLFSCLHFLVFRFNITLFFSLYLRQLSRRFSLFSRHHFSFSMAFLSLFSGLVYHFLWLSFLFSFCSWLRFFHNLRLRMGMMN